ncbi:transposable element Tcb2 transposase [Trichonephila clavipes]|nr:transposable element Tcb2 transposase [Trichonephila clavipes]
MWRPRDEDINPAFALQRHTSFTAGDTVWRVITYVSRLLLALIRDSMTAQRYVHDIRQPHVLSLIQQLPRAIYQQYDTRPHTARVSQDYRHTVTSLPWPARSPDLSR